MEIDVSEQHKFPQLSAIPVKQISDQATELMDFSEGICDIIFCDSDKISDLHKQYLNDPGITDVITFNLGDSQIEGEIYICVEQAQNQAAEYQVSLSDEISRLIIHGLLHLKGFEDNTEEKRKIMKHQEERFLKSIKNNEAVN